MMDTKRLETIALRGRRFTKRSLFLFFWTLVHFSLDKIILCNYIPISLLSFDDFD